MKAVVVAVMRSFKKAMAWRLRRGSVSNDALRAPKNQTYVTSRGIFFVLM